MPRVLLIGWDGASWKQIHPLLDAGAMPNLARAVDQGVMGKLATLSPLCTSLLWTSVGTGQYADRHGVLDNEEDDPRSGGVRPVTRASLRVPFVWENLAKEGVRCQSIGWPATHPAQGPATCISDGFPYGVPESIYPQALESTLLPLRFDPQEWTGSDLRLFIPELEKIDQDKDTRVAQLAVALAETVSTHAAATTLIESNSWELTAVWYGAIGRACVLFPESTDALYKDVVSGAYRFLDLLLGRLVQLAGPDAHVLIVSDRGACEPEWTPADGLGPRGMLCATGPGIAQDELAFGAGLLDIAPTLLSLFGFAPLQGMPGHAITEVCPAPPMRWVHDEAPVDLSGGNADSDVARELLELQSLGYKDPVAESVHLHAEVARKRRDFHLARVLLAQSRAAEAVPLLERLSSAEPNDTAARLYLAHAYYFAGQQAKCRALCEALIAESPDSPLAPLARAHLAIAEGNSREAQEQLASARQKYGITAALDTAIGEMYLQLSDYPSAAEAFHSAIRTDPSIAAAHVGLARASLAMGQYDRAAESALDAIRLHYETAAAHQLLGQALKALGREDASKQAFATGEMLRQRRS